MRLKPYKDKLGRRITKRVAMPYQEKEVEDEKYRDYSIMLKGIIYEISVRESDGKLYINQDEYQGY